MVLVQVICCASLLLWTPVAIHGQTAGSALSSVPVAQLSALTRRLVAYTQAFRTKNWDALYDLVSHDSKIGSDGKIKVSRRIFVRDMQETYDLERLIRFVPVRTDIGGLDDFHVYGCGELPYGNAKIERVAAVGAVWERGDWFFTNWDYPDPPEPCAHLSDPAWKPGRPLRLDGPMSQVSCELFTCTL